MENKKFYEILESVYKTLRIPIEKKENKIKPEKEKFIRKENFERKKKISGMMKNRLSLKDLSPVFRRNKKGKQLTCPDPRLFEKNFDVLTQMKKKIKKIENDRKIINLKVAKNFDETYEFFNQFPAELRLKDNNRLGLPKMQSARNSFGMIKEKFTR